MARSIQYPFLPVDYPSSDGLPLWESDFQRDPLIYVVTALKAFFQERDDVYVSGNLFIYYEEGNPQASAVVPAVAGAQGAGLCAGDHVAPHAQ